jgi:AMMECR1 domain-containing protein
MNEHGPYSLAGKKEFWKSQDYRQYISRGCRQAGLPAREWKKGVKIETFQAIVFGEKDLV